MFLNKTRTVVNDPPWAGLPIEPREICHAISILEVYRKAHESSGLAILFSDIEHSTQHQGRLGNARYAESIGRFRRIFRDCLGLYDAQEIETAGDSFLVAFVRPSDALAFALRVQAILRTERQQYADMPHMRIGVHYGQVEVEEHHSGTKPVDLYGIQVTTASRIMSLGCGDQILCSRQVHDDACAVWGANPPSQLGDVVWHPLGRDRLKGLRLPHEVIEVGERGIAPFKRPKGSLEQKLLTLSVFALMVVCLGASVLYTYTNIRNLGGQAVSVGNPMVSPGVSPVGPKVSGGDPAVNPQEKLESRGDSPESLYEEARKSELKGDYLNARRLYSRLVETPLEYVDVHSLYASMLKAQDGHASAVQAYAQLAKAQDGLAVKFIFASFIEDQEQRNKALEELANRYPDFGPVLYQLSREFSEAVLGKQTLDQRRTEKKYLKSFLDANQAGNVYRYYMDKSVVDKALEEAKERYQKLLAIPEKELENPVKVRFACNSPDTFVITMSIAEEAKQVAYKWDNETEYHPFDIDKVIVAHPGTSPRTFYVKYSDANGKEVGPYEFPFNPDSGLLERFIKDLKDDLKMSLPGGPGAIKESGGKKWLDLKSLRQTADNYRQGGPDLIKEVRYSFDSDSFDQVLAFDSEITENGSPSWGIAIPDDTKWYVFEVVYADGSKSWPMGRRLEPTPPQTQ